MNITLTQMLNLVGKLDDSQGEDTASHRFRAALKENVKEVGPVRDYIEECLRNAGTQYSKALQDLVNFLGDFLGFEVTFGRYQGIQGEIGFDGHWKSPTGFHLVIEVKTTDVYSVKTSTLFGYVNELISNRQIPDLDHALGVYVLGRPTPEIRQIENSIVVEKRMGQLRIISVESLISLAEMMTQFDIAHKDILDVLRPAGPRIDPLIDLMTRLVAQKGSQDAEECVPPIPPDKGQQQDTLTTEPREPETTCWLTPVKSTDQESAEACIERLVGAEHVYAFGEKTPGRKGIKPDDWICFYASGKGIVAHARVTSNPKKEPHPKVRDSERYPWTFSLDSAELYLDNPVVLDASARIELDAFKSRDPNNPWSWFVQSTHPITKNDFSLLTRGESVVQD